MKKFLVVFCLLCSALVWGQERPKKPIITTRILFVLDGSQSMLTKWESGTKMQVAQRLLSEMLDSLQQAENVEVALRVYGHQSPVPPQDCGDTKLEVPFGKNNYDDIKKRLYKIRPKGTTPIAYSLELCANDFPKKKNSRNIIILITDGIESCDGDPCAVSRQLQKKGIVLKPFVIGIGLDLEFRKTFECVGRYYDANNEERFKEVLDVVVSQALNSTTLQVNLLDSKKKATETNVNMTFYDEFSGKIKYNFMHTLNRNKLPDTLRIDPLPTYRIKVHTIPAVEIDNIQLNAGEHNTVDVETPQGSILVKTNDRYYNKPLQFLVQDRKTGKILNVQDFNIECKYLIGTYKVQVLTLPIMVFDDLKVKQSETTTIQIPEPGLVTFIGSANAVGAIYMKKGKELVRIKNLKSDNNIQTFAILPGTYTVISRPINAIECAFTSQKTFKVVSGEAIKVDMF